MRITHAFPLGSTRNFERSLKDFRDLSPGSSQLRDRVRRSHGVAHLRQDHDNVSQFTVIRRCSKVRGQVATAKYASLPKG
jgi:hypothetical protein